MQAFRFDNAYESRWVETQLRDLGVALSQTSNLKVEFRLQSVWSFARNTLSVSSLFESLDVATRMDVQKADVYLRAIGNRRWTTFEDVANFYELSKGFRHPKFVRHLFCLSEDLRLMLQIVVQRPGTLRHFRARIDAYARWLLANRQKRLRDGAILDVLLTDIYLKVHQAHLSNGLAQVQRETFGFGAANATQLSVEHVDRATSLQHVTSSQDVCRAVIEYYQLLGVQDRLDVPDLNISVFDMDWASVASALGDKREGDEKLDARRRRSVETSDSMDDEERESIEMWNQPSESKAPGAFLMDLDENSGVQTAGTNARLGQDEVESVTVKRGYAGQGKKADDDGEQDAQADLRTKQPAEQSHGLAVKSVNVPRGPISSDARDEVLQWASIVSPVKRRLERIFEKTLLHRMELRQGGKRYGRLDRRLTTIWTDENPRLFYHKRADDRRLDVAVQFLVDCSGSMFDQLDQTKPHLYLMHEIMRKIRIPHDICGFWEDSDEGTLTQQATPVTKFCHVITWFDCFEAGVCAYLDQLKPQLDNRDGFAIRTIGKELLKRHEKQKWLLILSDGEPAADHYIDAIDDTKNAIRWLRESGVHVLHLSISSWPLSELEIKALRQLYGHGSIAVNGVDQLPTAIEKTMKRILKETTYA